MYVVMFLGEKRSFRLENDAIDYQIKLLSQAGVMSTIEENK